MQNMTKRGSVYYIRFIVPKERWQDVGRATEARNGIRKDIIKSLETKDYREALRRRADALEVVRQNTNTALLSHDLPPLHGDWKPSWSNSHRRLTEQALMARKALENADAHREPLYADDDPESGMMVGEDNSDRDCKAEIVRDTLSCIADEIGHHLPGKKGQKAAIEAYQRAHDIAFGNATPLSVLLDRWFPSLEGVVTQELIDRHHRAFSRLGAYLADSIDLKTDKPEDYIRTISIEQIDKRTAGHFREWLEKLPAIGPRVVGFHLSTMNSFWKWAHDVGYAVYNPWEGSTRGLKKKIALASRERGEKRPYTDEELVTLFTQAKERLRHPKKWPWARVIHDMLRGCYVLSGVSVAEQMDEYCTQSISV
ncbi:MULTISPECIES: hypothetical protein [Acetobacter]|nr:MULTISPECIES: hypothetical protein [Acetobacter]MCP1270786.1 hypothetical protein [Acetobacter cerevisiae]MCP1278791.1 hypothetical protein [Acetobacter cerevisiae]